MPNQRIGVTAVFQTRGFSRGLNTYLRGIDRATRATQVATRAIASYTRGFRSINRAARPAIQATANYTQSARSATRRTREFSVAGVALGTAIGQIAVEALRSFLRVINRVSAQLLDTIQFFERLDISIEFFNARALVAEDATLSFTDALAQGAIEAQGLSVWLRQLAIASPFTTRDVGTLFRVSQAYGLTREEAELLTPRLLDLAAAGGFTSDILERVALAVGQIRARGKLTGEEVRQLGNSGVPIRDILVKALGFANDEFDELLEKGQLTSDVVIPAIIRDLERFEGASERISFGTITGIVSAFQEFIEIASAQFFISGLSNTIDLFARLFETLNQPEVLAFIQVLGESFGVFLRNSIIGLTETVRDALQAWNDLGPVVQRQIIVFGAVLVGTTLLAAAFGTLALAVRLLVNPITLAIFAFSAFVAEYSAGFRVTRRITEEVSDAVVRAVGRIPEAFIFAEDTILGEISAIIRGLFRLVDEANEFGVAIMAAFAEGMTRGAIIISDILRSIGDMFAFWLAPGSPPRAVPDIDLWGEGLAGEYLRGFANADVADEVAVFGARVDREIKNLISSNRPTVIEAPPLEIGGPLTSGRLPIPEVSIEGSPFANSLPDQIRNTVEDSIEQGAEDAVQAAQDAGFRVSEEFVNGFLDHLPSLEQPMQEEISRIVASRTLDIDLAFGIGDIVGDLDSEDFDAVSRAQSFVSDILSTQVDTGAIDPIDLPRLLFGSNEAIAEAVAEMREFGDISEDSFNRIRNATGPAGDTVVEFLQGYEELAAATEQTQDAQDRLNAVTEHYEEVLRPIREELQAINEAVQFTGEQERIASLQRLINNQGVSFGRKQAARAQIEQIQAQRRVRDLERERDAAEEAAETELEERESVEDKLREEFSLLQDRIDLQLDQIGLVGQEASIVERLNEEAARAAEKRTEELDLQAELVKLQGQELSDLVKAARAKAVLDDESSTELERQKAIIDLQEVALARRNREAKAFELGIPLDELTRLRDLLVMPEDIGRGGDGAGAGEGEGIFAGMEEATESLLNAGEITEEFNKTLETTRERWIEIQEEIRNTAQEINDSLPIPLQFFSTGEEGEEGEPPIIRTLKLIAAAILGSGAIVAINTLFNAIGGLITKFLAFGRLLLPSGIIATGIGFIARLLVAFTGPLAILIGAATLISIAWNTNFLRIQERTRATVNRIQEDIERVPEFFRDIFDLPGKIADIFGDREFMDAAIADLNQAFIDFMDAFGENLASFPNPIVALFKTAFEQLRPLFDEAVPTMIDDFLQAIQDFGPTPTGLFAFLFRGAREGASEIHKIGTDASGEMSRGAKEEIERQKPSLTEATQSLFDVEDESTFLQKGLQIGGNIFQGITDSIIGEDASKQITDTSKVVGDSIGKGVKTGIEETEEDAKTGFGNFLLNLIGLGEETVGAKSPATVPKERIGIPFGQGIIEGISEVIDGASGDVSSVFTDMIEVLEEDSVQLRKDVVKEFGNLNKALDPILTALYNLVTDEYEDLIKDNLEALDDFSDDSRDIWIRIREESIEELMELRFDALEELDTLSTSMKTKLDSIKTIVVGIFQTMRTESEAQMELMRDNIVAILVGEEDSLLSMLNDLLIGDDQIIPRNIGLSFMEGLARGITENKELVASALREAMAFALREGAAEIEASSPSAVAARQLGKPMSEGIAQGILNGFEDVAGATIAVMSHAMNAPLRNQSAPRPVSSSVTNVNNVTDARQFNLNVNSGQSSQGIISDFTVLQSMAGG